MMKKIFFLLVVILINMSIASFSDTKLNELEVYTGVPLNLKSYMLTHHPVFSFNNDLSIQNLNASVIEVRDAYMIFPKRIGKGLVVLSNGQMSVSIHVSVVSPIQAAHLSKKYTSLLLGETYPIDVQIELKKGVSMTETPLIIWKSLRPNVASVVQGNKIVTKSAGNTVLTGMTENGEELFKLEVTVLGHDYKLKVRNPEAVRSLNVGEILDLNAYLGTKEVTDSVKWVSLTPHILKVDAPGQIMAIGEGRGKIEALTSTGSKATYEISAYSMIDRIELNHSKITFRGVGQSQQLMFNLYPKDKQFPPILNGFKYVSSNPKIITVNQSGLIKAEGPGIATVSVIFEDSQKKVICSVEVLSKDKFPVTNYIPVEKIDITPYEGIGLIGQKIPIDYTIFPENATEKTINFEVLQGANSQIKYFDQKYYFIPEKRGLIKINLTGADGRKSQTSISVTSPIKSLELSLDNHKRVGRKEQTIYVGEMPELIARLYVKKGFTQDDIYPSSLIYNVDDEKIATIVAKGGKQYLKGLKRGRTRVTVKTLEGLHETSLWVNVENPVLSVFTDTEVKLPVGTSYKPRVSVNLIETAKANEGVYNVNSIISLKVNQLYIEEEFIDSEIDYEVEKLKTFGQPPYSSEVLGEMKRHENRLGQLKQYKGEAENKYVLLKNTSVLKDRYNRSYKLYSIHHNQVQSTYPVKLNLEIGLKGLPYTTETVIDFVNGFKGIEIVRLNNSYDCEALAKEYGLENSLKGLQEEDKVNLMIAYVNNFQLFESAPDYELLNALEVISSDSILFESMRPFENKVTKADLLYLSYLLHKKYVDRSLKMDSLEKSYYHDVVDTASSKLISLGYVAASNEWNFGLKEEVSRRMLNDMLRKIVPTYDETTRNADEILTHRDLVIELSRLIR